MANQIAPDWARCMAAVEVGSANGRHMDEGIGEYAQCSKWGETVGIYRFCRQHARKYLERDGVKLFTEGYPVVSGWTPTTPADVDLEALDPGIRDVVRLVSRAGFETTDSGDGVSKPAEWYASGEAMPFRHVVATTTPRRMVQDAERLAAVLGPGWKVTADYEAQTRSAHLFARELFEQERQG